jgi:diacylglycerol kinase (ATP)
MVPMARSAVKVGLIHNHQAGDALAVEDLTQAIHRHGHEVVAVCAKSDGLDALRLDRLDLVAAAGGDGTIAAVARALARSLVPLGILAMGTANNIARSLGIPSDIDAAVATWAAARPRPLDLGVATGPWGERWFIESVGGGLVTHSIVVMDRQADESPTTTQQLARAVSAHADVLGLTDPVPWRLVLDGGEPIEGEFLLLEVLNMGTIGPNLTLTESASPWDGRLTVVAATEEDRPAIAAYLHRRSSGNGHPPSLRTWHVRELTIGTGDRLHVDDTVVGDPGATGARVRIEPGILRVLVPASPVHLAERPARNARLPTLGDRLPTRTRRAPARRGRPRQ